MATTKQKHVFLSFNHRSKDVVKKINEILVNEGISTWMNAVKDADSAHWNRLSSAIEEAHVFCCFVTENYCRSTNCKREIEYASRLGRPIVLCIFSDEMETRRSEWLELMISYCPNVIFKNSSYDEIQNKKTEFIQKIKTYTSNIFISGAPVKKLNPNASNRQAFISYSHDNKEACKKFYQTLKQTELFSTIWIDTICLKGDMATEIPIAVRQSNAFFPLLSEAYCRSRTCRKEYDHAYKNEVKIYPVIIEENFKVSAHEWLDFYIGSDLYYRIDKDDNLHRLMKAVEIDSTVNHK